MVERRQIFSKCIKRLSDLERVLHKAEQAGWWGNVCCKSRVDEQIPGGGTILTVLFSSKRLHLLFLFSMPSLPLRCFLWTNELSLCSLQSGKDSSAGTARTGTSCLLLFKAYGRGVGGRAPVTYTRAKYLNHITPWHPHWDKILLKLLIELIVIDYKTLNQLPVWLLWPILSAFPWFTPLYTGPSWLFLKCQTCS